MKVVQVSFGIYLKHLGKDNYEEDIWIKKSSYKKIKDEMPEGIPTHEFPGDCGSVIVEDRWEVEDLIEVLPGFRKWKSTGKYLEIHLRKLYDDYGLDYDAEQQEIAKYFHELLESAKEVPDSPEEEDKMSLNSLYEVVGCDELGESVFAHCTSEELAQKAIKLMVEGGWDEDILQVRKSNLHINEIILDDIPINLQDIPSYLTDPMPLEEQYTICDEDGYLEGDIVLSMPELFENDEDELLDLMSNRLVGEPLLTDISYRAIGTTDDGDIIVRVHGSIEECDGNATIPGEKSELDIVCEKIKSAVLTAGIDAVCDLTKVDVHGKTLEEMEELVDDAIDEMTIMGLIPYFKKYVVGK